MANHDAAIAQLLRQFNAVGLDRDVLVAVLEMHGGNVQNTINFLQAGEGQFVDPGPNADGLPPNYMQKPQNWVQPKPFGSDVEASSLEGRCLALKAQILSSETSFLQLFNISSKDPHFFVSVLLLMIESGVEVAAPAKAKILAVCMATKMYDVMNYLLERPHYAFGLPEVLRAVKLLDMPRQVRQLNKKLLKLEENGHVAAKTLRSMRSRLEVLAREYAEAHVSSVNGSLIKRVKKWVRSIPKEHLQFFALQMPKEPWKELADICHFAPSDFSIEWFLPFCFGAEPPNDSLLKAGALTSANVLEMVKKFKIPYSFLRKQIQNLSDQVKAEIATYEKLSLVIWYYEELDCALTDAVLTKRLENGEDPELPYGKLMERLLFLRMNNKAFYHLLMPIAERRLRSIRLPLERPVVVFGDASYSMDVAIRVSTIISSLLTVLAGASIFFFNVSPFAPPHAPTTIPQVLDVALNTKADGLTATACCLREYYEQKKVVKFFIMVTDEIENEPSNGTFFAQLFYKYYTEICPARLVMVSFLENPNNKGRMVRALESFGIVPLQFRLDATRPDLSKLDSLLGLLSAECNFFSIQAQAVSDARAKGSTIDQLVGIIREGPENELKRLDSIKGNSNNESAAVAKEESLVQRFRKLHLADDSVPNEFLCPISQEVMSDPVVAADGRTYERAAIQAWFGLHSTSPLTNQPLETKLLFPNLAVKNAIAEWIEKKMKEN